MQTRTVVTAIVAGAALAFLLAGPAPAPAQEPGTISVTGEAGIGLPVSDLSDVSDPGPAFRFATDYAVGRSFGVRADVAAEVFESITGPGGEGPTIRLFRLTVGPSWKLAQPTGESGLRLTVHGGGGAAAFTAGRTLVGTGSDVRIIDFTEVYPSLDGGFSVGYKFSRFAGVHFNGGASLTFIEEADTEPFVFLNPGVEQFSTLISVPLTVGVRLSFPR